MARQDETNDSPSSLVSMGTWHHDYTSLEQLLSERTTIAILGRVLEVDAMRQLGAMPITDTNVRVTEVLAPGRDDSPPVAAGGTITVAQVGSQSAAAAGRLLEEGDEVLLFLGWNEVQERWAIVGPPHGSFVRDGGHFAHRNFVGDDADAGGHEGGHPLRNLALESSAEAFVELVREAGRSRPAQGTPIGTIP